MGKIRHFTVGLWFLLASVSACAESDHRASNYENESISVREATEIAKKELQLRGINYEGYSVGFFMWDEKLAITFTDRNSKEPGAHFSVIVLPDGSIFGIMPGE